MTGAYLRVKRNGKFESVEVEHLTDEERATIFIGRDNAEIIRWLNMTCEMLRENELLLKGLVEDGILTPKED